MCITFSVFFSYLPSAKYSFGFIRSCWGWFRSLEVASWWFSPAARKPRSWSIFIRCRISGPSGSGSDLWTIRSWRYWERETNIAEKFSMSACFCCFAVTLLFVGTGPSRAIELDAKEGEQQCRGTSAMVARLTSDASDSTQRGSTDNIRAQNHLKQYTFSGPNPQNGQSELWCMWDLSAAALLDT